MREKDNTLCKIPSALAQQTATQKPRRDLPLLLWDGDCGFCARWMERGKKVTKDRIRYAPYQTLETDADGRLKDHTQVSVEDCRRAVQLIMPDGKHYKAAEAIFRALDYAGTQNVWLWLYRHVPGFKFLSEFVYRFVAGHRSRF